MDRPPTEPASTDLGAPDARALAGFYERLLGRERVADDEGWVQLVAPNCGARLSEHQPQEDVRVLLDPVGHVFCLFPHPELA